MAESFDKALEALLKSDPLLQDVPAYSNKNKMKTLGDKHAEETNSLLNSRKLNATLLTTLSDNLKKVSMKFQEEYNTVKTLKESHTKLKEKVKTEEKAVDSAKNIEKGLETKFRDMVNSLINEETQKQKEIDEYLSKRQSELTDEEKRHQELLKSEYENEQYKKFLLEKKESVFKEIENATKEKEREIDEKRKNVEETVKNIDNDLTMYDHKSREIPNDDLFFKESENFIEKYSSDYDEALKLWEEINGSSNVCDQMLTSINKKITKIQKLKNTTEEERNSLHEKFMGSVEKLNELIAENLTLRGKLASEQKKQESFQKLAEDLRLKINGKGGAPS